MKIEIVLDDHIIPTLRMKSGIFHPTVKLVANKKPMY